MAGFERIVVNGMVDRLLDLPWYVAAFGPLIGLALAAMILRWPGGRRFSCHGRRVPPRVP